MAETPTKIHYPTNADTFDPAGDMETLARSVTHIVPVDNASDRNALADAYGPSAERPLFVYRADTDTLERHAGDGWDVMFRHRSEVITLPPPTSSWSGTGARLEVFGSSAVLDLNMQRSGSPWSGTLTFQEAIPSGLRPSFNCRIPGINQPRVEATFAIEVSTSGVVSLYGVDAATNNWVRGQVAWLLRS